jgi:hypothetical protein
MTFMPGGGIMQADTVCNTDAEAHQLQPNFQALLGTQAGSPRSRFGAGSPWVRPDHVVVSKDLASLDAPINVTLDLRYEEGMAWSGSDHLDDPSMTADDSCGEWMNAGGPFGRIGYVNATELDANLSGTRTSSCITPHPLWCLEK